MTTSLKRFWAQPLKKVGYGNYLLRPGSVNGMIPWHDDCRDQRSCLKWKPRLKTRSQGPSFAHTPRYFEE